MYLNKCPRCGEEDRLYVAGGTFWAAGCILDCNGYDLSDANEWQTENEIVFCDACKKTFSIGEVVDPEELPEGATLDPVVWPLQLSPDAVKLLRSLVEKEKTNDPDKSALVREILNAIQEVSHG